MVLVGRRLVQRVCKGVEAFRRSGGELWREQEDGGDLVKASRANPTADPTRETASPRAAEGGGHLALVDAVELADLPQRRRTRWAGHDNGGC